MSIDYPRQWDKLPKKQRKQKIREFKKQYQKRVEVIKKVRNISIVIVLLLAGGTLYKLLTQKSPEEIAFQEEVKQISLEGKVEEFEIEGRDHVGVETEVNYNSNPPTSGKHLSQAENWGIYDKGVDDRAAVHSLEHGGIWISYQDITDEEKRILEEIGRKNPQSTIVSPRLKNDDKIVISSWGKMMRLKSADKALIQKYIDTYKNQSPEKLVK